MTKLDEIISDNFETLKTLSGVSIRYVREDSSVEMIAVAGSTDYAIEELSGLLESIQSRDFLVLASELVLGGSPVLPERGDEVREVLPNGEELIYPVMSPSGSRHYEYSDPYRVVIRIHTKQTR